jgi:RimJ/RimL family protein N-acetyltransferase
MKLQLVPFKSFHLPMLQLREWDQKYLAASPDLSAVSAQYFEGNSFAFTGISPAGVVGCGGFARIFKTNWEGWVYTTDLFDVYGLQVGLIARRLVDNFFKHTGVLRLQAPIDSRYPAAMRFAEVLRMKPESTLKQYGPDGQDFIMYARTKGSR